MPILERAYQLAETGSYGDVSAVKKALIAEGYLIADVQTHVRGNALHTSLRKIFMKARAAGRPATSGDTGAS